MSFVDEFLMITDGTVRVRILEHDGRHGFVHFRHLIQVGDTHIESHGLRPCYNASECLRMQFVRQQENFSPVLPVKWILSNWVAVRQMFWMFTWRTMRQLRLRLFLRQGGKHWPLPGPLTRPPSSDNWADSPAVLERSPADKACTEYTLTMKIFQ